MKFALFLVALTVLSSCAASKTFVWRWTNNWLDVNNWANGLPKAGDAVKIPFFENAGDDCQAGPACIRGGLVSIDSDTDVSIEVSELVMPARGSIELPLHGTIDFFAKDETAEKLWQQPAPQWSDFKCANNWIESTSKANKDFEVPCSTDTVVFTNEHALLVNFPKNSFAADALNQHGGDVTFDPSQFYGYPLSTDGTKCRQRYGSITGFAFCNDWCINTCISLNSNATHAKIQEIAQTYAILNPVKSALAAIEVTDGVRATPTIVTGEYQSGQMLTDLTDAQKFTFVDILQNSLKPHIWDCDLVGASVLCNVTGNITRANVDLYSTRDPLTGARRFVNSFLQNQVDQITPVIINKILAGAKAALYKQRENAVFVSGTMLISKSFADTLASPAAIASLTTAVAARLEVAESDIADIRFTPTSDARLVVMTVVLLQSTGLSAQVISAIILSSDPSIFTVVLPGDVQVPLFAVEDEFTPFGVSLNSLTIQVQDAVLAAKLPLSEQDQALFDQQIRTHVSEQGSNADDILSIYVYPKLQSSRRNADFVTISLYASSVSSFFGTYSEQLFASSFLNSGSAVILGQEIGDVEQVEALLQKSAALIAYANSEDAIDALEVLQDSFASFAVAPSNLQTIEYNWDALTGLESDATAIAPFKNSDCAYLTNASKSPDSDMVLAFRQRITKYLPVQLEGVTLANPISCQPKVPGLLDGDEDALFNVTGISFTTHSLFIQSSKWETSVRGVVSDALRFAMLSETRSVIQAKIDALEFKPTTTTKSPEATGAPSASSTSSPLPMIGAAVGAIVVIAVVVVVIVLVRRQRRVVPTTKRPVTAFVNPLYGNADDIKREVSTIGGDDSAPSRKAGEVVSNPLRSLPTQDYEEVQNVLQAYAAVDPTLEVEDEPANMPGLGEDFVPEDAGYLDVDDN